MSPTLIISIVRGLVRIGSVAADAYEQYIRDKPAMLPLVDMLDAAPDAKVAQARNAMPGFETLVTTDPHLKKYANYNALQGRARDVAIAELFAALTVFRQKQRMGDDAEAKKEGLNTGDVDAAVAGVFVAQWSKAGGPLGPFARVALAMADVTLEFVGGNPQVLGIGGNGEKLIGALAKNISDLIPDATDTGAYGPKALFGERLAATFLRAGLQTAADNTTLVFDEDYVNELVEKTLPPIINALPANVADQVQWEKIGDALMGPAASAALQVIAENQVKFLGSRFNPEEAIGALTKAMFTTAATQGLEKQFTKDGMIVLFRALVKVAADKPEMFVGRPDGSDADKIATDAFQKVMATLAKAPIPFKKDLGGHLAAAVLEAVNENRGLFLDPTKPWENAASQIVGQVIDGFKEAFQTGASDPLDKLFSADQLIEFARIVIAQAAKTPGMITGDEGDDSVKQIISAIGKAMAADDKLLLTKDDWTTIITVAAEEAARSPGRLFGIDTATAEGQLADRLISVAIKAAAADIKGATTGALFGATLTETISFLLKTASGNAKKMLDNALAKTNEGDIKLEALFAGLNKTVKIHFKEFGHREWLRLFKVLALELIEDGSIIDFNSPDIDTLLEEKLKEAA